MVDQILEEKLNDSFAELEISPEQRNSIMIYLNLLKNKDVPTHEHSIRVGLKGKEIAKYTHMVEPKTLYYPGLLHDIGKALTNSASLVKTTGFNEKDRKELLRHPVDSYRILKGIHDFSAEVSLRHHYFQGDKSYPKHVPKSHLGFSNKTNAMINYCARLISLIDFQDAASHRKNDNFSPGNPQFMEDNKVKEILINTNPDQEYLIKSLYEAKIFGEGK